MAKESYTPFSEQLMRCRDAGDMFIIHDAPTLKGEVDVMVCVKYKTYCHSKACIEERTGEDDRP